MANIAQHPRPSNRLGLVAAGLVALAALLTQVRGAAAGDTALQVTWHPSISSPHAAQPPEPAEAKLLALCGPADGALMDVAAQAARRQLAGAPALTADELAFSMRAAGDPHVWPKAWSISGTGISEDDALSRFKTFAATLRPVGARRCGVARIEGPEQRSVVTVIAVDALADLSPLPTTARVGQWLTLEGKMLVPASGVQVVLLGPRGAPRTVPSSLSGGRIRSTFSVDQPGQWLVQVLATASTGPRPVLEATVFAGVQPPAKFVHQAVPGEEAATGAKDDADAMLRMINAARVAEGLSPLVRDAALDKLSHAHSEEMMKARQIGHDVGGGDPRARLEAAGIQPRIAGENVAFAGTLQNAHRALWASPSHRGNLLLEGFKRVGVAVTRGADGSVWVTELFTG